MVDNGSGMCKAGFAGDDAPRAIPERDRAPPHRQLVRAGLVAGILAGAVGLMSVFGFMLISPILALVLMCIGGERRPAWLAVGALVMPALIWFCVAFLLGRVLI